MDRQRSSNGDQALCVERLSNDRLQRILGCPCSLHRWHTRMALTP